MSGKRLPPPPGCPNTIYQILRECWNADPHGRKQPQAVMRDINQILYQGKFHKMLFYYILKSNKYYCSL